MAKQNVPTAFGSSSSRRTSSFTCNCQPKIAEKNGDPEKHVYLLWLTPLILTMKCQQKHCWNLFWIFLEIYHLNWWALSVSIHVIFTRIPGVYSFIGIFTKCFQFNAFGINKLVLIIFLNPKRSIGEVWNHSATPLALLLCQTMFYTTKFNIPTSCCSCPSTFIPMYQQNHLASSGSAAGRACSWKAGDLWNILVKEIFYWELLW